MRAKTVVLLATCGVLVWPGSSRLALAQPGAGGAAAKPRRVKRKRHKFTLYLFQKAGHRKQLKKVIKFFRKALKRDKRLRYKAMQTLLEPPRKSLKRLLKGDKLQAAAKKDLDNLEMAGAIEKYKKAVRYYERGFVAMIRLRQKTAPLARALRNLAIAYSLDGKAKEAKESVRRLMVLEPNLRWSADNFPKAMKKMVNNERQMFDEFGATEVFVKTEPKGARIYLNGRRAGRGKGRIKIEGVRIGWNYISARMPGYRTTTMRIFVEPPKLERVTLKLRRFKQDPIPMIEGAKNEIGAPKPGPSLTQLAARLKVPLIVIGTAAVDVDQAKIKVYVYDFRLGTMLRGPIELTTSLDFPEDKATKLGASVWKGLRVDGTAAGKTKKKKGPSVSLWKRMSAGWAKFRRSKAFWPTVGSVAGVVVLGAVLGAALGATRRRTGWKRVVLSRVRRGALVRF